MVKKEIDLYKHIWEGWRVIDFINKLEPRLDDLYNTYLLNPYFQTLSQLYHCENVLPFVSKSAMREYCKNHQPYYKKIIPEVSNYFIQKYNIKK